VVVEELDLDTKDVLEVRAALTQLVSPPAFDSDRGTHRRQRRDYVSSHRPYLFVSHRARPNALVDLVSDGGRTASRSRPALVDVLPIDFALPGKMGQSGA
jgi:hypothetical protein